MRALVGVLVVTMDDKVEKLALELFLEIHRRAGHEGVYTEASFDELRKPAWCEIAKAILEGFAPKTRWLDDYAFALFERVHDRVGTFKDSGIGRYVWHSFQNNTPRRLFWYEVARVLDEKFRGVTAEDMRR